MMNKLTTDGQQIKLFPYLPEPALFCGSPDLRRQCVALVSTRCSNCRRTGVPQEERVRRIDTDVQFLIICVYLCLSVFVIS